VRHPTGSTGGGVHAPFSVYPAAPPLRDVEVTASVILTIELVSREIRAGRLDRLLELEDDLRHLILRLLVGVTA
jgi:hypothetical protein